MNIYVKLMIASYVILGLAAMGIVIAIVINSITLFLISAIFLAVGYVVKVIASNTIPQGDVKNANVQSLWGLASK